MGTGNMAASTTKGIASSPTTSSSQFIPVDPKTVGMKLPISDVYHRGIYPGDVLECWVADERRLLVTVEWTGWRYKFAFHPDSELRQYPDDFVISHSRIVGNIWDGIE